MSLSLLAFGSGAGTTNGTTPVTVVPSPGSSVNRVLKRLSVYNADTAAISVLLQFKDTATSTTTTIDASGTLAVGQVYTFGINMEIDALVATTQTYQVVLLGAKTTTDAQWKATYTDVG